MEENQNTTYTCKICGEEFVRRVYQSATHEYTYCSTRCTSEDADSQTGRNTVSIYGMPCQSGYERKFVEHCISTGIPIRRYDRKRTGDGLMNFVTQQGRNSVYGPDFFIAIEGREIPVEIKGWFDGEDRFKVKTWRTTRGPLFVVGAKEILSISDYDALAISMTLDGQMKAHEIDLYDNVMTDAVGCELREPAYVTHPERVGLDVDLDTYERSLEFWKHHW